MRLQLSTLCVTLALASALRAKDTTPAPVEIEKLMASQTDVLADAALTQPGGPSYEFFRDQLPPLRYVDANFRQYPIVLSAPAAFVKGRLVSNGSSVNALARTRTWINETGRPVTFYVGDRRDLFGANLSNLDGPKLADGYLPIVQLKYTSDGATYAQEAFAGTDPQLSAFGTIFVKFTLLRESGRNYKSAEAADKDPASTLPVAGVEAAENLAALAKGFDEKIEAQIEGPELFGIKGNRIFALTEGSAPKDDDKIVAATYPRWIINPARGAFIAPLKTGESAYLAIFTKPAEQTLQFKLSPETYDAQRSQCAKTWNDLLNRGMCVQTGEQVVNNAWRAELIANFQLIKGDQMRYSAGNQYDGKYIGEGGDAIRCLALWGHAQDAEKLIPAQFNYSRKGLEFHQAGLKLQMIAHVYRLTHDKQMMQELRPLWQKEIDVILNGRKTDNGMFPREKYCGDVDTRVFSLNSNSNAWRALRDMSDVLADLGETEQAAKLDATQKEYRKVILDTLAGAIDRSVDPPFVPIALSGEEHPHRPIWGTTIGSYWNLMINYVLGSGVFTLDSQTATDVLRYLQQNGGLCMGMLRARATPGNFWVYGGRINDLYGMRYALALLRRDEVDRALVSFYGKLAQGMTRDTFIGCEGSSMAPLDEFGRQMYLPPNSAGNANFLQQLRYILVQDYDMDDDGWDETLRLAFATPRRWLTDGAQLKVEHAPTTFGEVSFVIKSDLKSGAVTAEVDLPKSAPRATLLRLRLPDDYRVTSAIGAGQDLKVIDGNTIDLSSLRGHATISAKVSR